MVTVCALVVGPELGQLAEQTEPERGITVPRFVPCSAAHSVLLVLPSA